MKPSRERPKEGLSKDAKKERIDLLMVARGLAQSRERARALILAGRVLAAEQKVDKPGTLIGDETPIRILGEDLRYVSRGGLKLEAALKHWQIPTEGRACLDIGTSTGGFTDCLLQAGAARVVAVDTGYGQMDAGLRADPRVRLLEKTNARYLTAVSLWGGEEPQSIALIVMDVSFISATLVLPSVVASVRRSSSSFELVLLVKPQFEVGREQVGKGGIVRDPEAQQAAVVKVQRAVEETGGSGIEVIESPILGSEGNREFLLHARYTV